jgi:hypothetical protein
MPVYRKILKLKKIIASKNQIIDSANQKISNYQSLIKIKKDSITFLTKWNQALSDTISNSKKALIPDDNGILGIPFELAKFIIPVIITILIFAIGQFITWLKAKKEIKNKVSSNRHLILNWIDLMEDSISQQVKSCSEFSNRLSNSIDIQPETFQYNKLMANKIDDFSVDIFVDSFVTNSEGALKEQDKWCFNLISQFHFLKNIEEQIPDIYSKYQTQTFEIMNEWNVNFKKLDDLISKQSRQINITPTHPTATYHGQIMNIANTWRAAAPNGRSSVTDTINNLVTPISNLTTTELKTNPTNDYAFNLSAILQELRISHLKWSTNKNGNVIVFKKLGENIEAVFQNLQQTKVNIKENTKVKSIWKIS